MLHINCRLFVSSVLGSVEIKHMHKKTQIKLFHAGLKKKNMQNVQTFPNLQLQNLENICSIPVPPLNCALSGDRTCQKKLSLWLLHEFLRKFMRCSLVSHAARRAALTAARIPLASSLVYEPVLPSSHPSHQHASHMCTIQNVLSTRCKNLKMSFEK